MAKHCTIISCISCIEKYYQHHCRRTDGQISTTYIINNVSLLLPVQWIDNCHHPNSIGALQIGTSGQIEPTFVITIFLVSVKILRLSTMTRVYELNSVNSVACVREIASHNGKRGNHWAVHS